MLLLNEKDYYENLLKNGFAKHFNRRDINCIIRQMRKQGKKDWYIEDFLFDFCEKWVENFTVAKYEDAIKKIMKLDIQDVKLSENVTFTKAELERIKSIKDDELEKVLFVMATIGKLYGTNYLYLNSGSSLLLRDIFEIANIKKKLSEQELFLYKLCKMGHIKVNLKPICRYDINIVNSEESEVFMTFEPTQDMVLHYEKYKGANIISCDCCGKMVKKTNNKMKYCKACAIKIAKEQRHNFYEKSTKLEK